MSAPVKDGIQAFADEVTLIRHEIEKLQRTSLDRDEASDLHGHFMRDIEDLRETFSDTHEAFRGALEAHREEITREATGAATKAAQEAVEDIRKDLAAEREKLAQSASEARRATRRFSGGVWTFGGLMLASGLLLGGVGHFWMQGRADAQMFGEYPAIYCESAGGRRMETQAWEICGVPIRRKENTGE